MTGSINPTRIVRTESDYLYRAKLLQEKYQAQTGFLIKDDIHAFIKWLVDLKPTILPATWRQYKSSIRFFARFEKIPFIDETLEQIGVDGCLARKDSRKTSATKQKKFPEDEVNKVNSFLRDTSSRSFWATPTAVFIKASILTGLRPDEWKNAIMYQEIQDNGEVIKGPILRVSNAKNTNDRAHGEFRHLVLSEFSPGDIQIIMYQLRLVKECLGPSGPVSFEKYFKACQQTIYRATRAIWSRRSGRKKWPSLYTARHQFCANLKKANYSKVEVAALMGHGTDETAGTHYGRRSAGRGGQKLAKPLNSEVQRIKQIIKQSPSPTIGPSQN